MDRVLRASLLLLAPAALFSYRTKLTSQLPSFLWLFGSLYFTWGASFQGRYGLQLHAQSLWEPPIPHNPERENIAGRFLPLFLQPSFIWLEAKGQTWGQSEPLVRRLAH